MGTALKANDCAVAGELFGVIPLQSTLSTVHVVWSTTGIHPFAAELP